MVTVPGLLPDPDPRIRSDLPRRCSQLAPVLAGRRGSHSPHPAPSGSFGPRHRRPQHTRFGLSSRHSQSINMGAVMSMAADTPTIVLVHGAWADATGFDAEIRALQDRGYTAIGFANPLRDLAGDAAYLAEYLRTLSGPIVLVGHSYGGNVISTTAIGNAQVQALVYLNGWMCDVGESQQQLLERFEGSLVGPSIRPVPFTNPDGSEGTDFYLAPEAFHEAFAADVDPATAAVMAAAQRPYAAAAFAAAPAAPPAWNTLPCWYLLGTEDKAIPPELQRFMAERASATIVEVAASHVSFVSQPEAATQLILQAAEATAVAD
jgi:pimeloyl-ACP methyl ester carboxylesterase